MMQYCLNITLMNMHINTFDIVQMYLWGGLISVKL